MKREKKYQKIMRYKMTDDIIINKSEIIKRCVKRIKEEYDDNAEN